MIIAILGGLLTCVAAMLLYLASVHCRDTDSR